MKFRNIKKLNESDLGEFGDVLLKRFGKYFDIYDDKNGKYWYLDCISEPYFDITNITIGPIEENPYDINDFSDLIKITQTISFSNDSSKETVKELESNVKWIARDLKHYLRT